MNTPIRSYNPLSPLYELFPDMAIGSRVMVRDKGHGTVSGFTGFSKSTNPTMHVLLDTGENVNLTPFDNQDVWPINNKHDEILSDHSLNTKPKAMIEPLGTDVILYMTHRLRELVRDGHVAEAIELSKLIGKIEELFPDAEQVIRQRFGKGEPK